MRYITVTCKMVVRSLNVIIPVTRYPQEVWPQVPLAGPSPSTPYALGPLPHTRPGLRPGPPPPPPQAGPRVCKARESLVFLRFSLKTEEKKDRVRARPPAAPLGTISGHRITDVWLLGRGPQLHASG